MKKYVLLDCDHVLLDGTEDLIAFIKDRYGLCDPQARNLYPADWEIFGGKIGKPNIEKTRPYIESFVADDIFGKSPPVPGAVEGVRELIKMGYNLEVVTSVPDVSGAKERRIHNLQNVFGDVIDEVHMIGWFGSKKECLKSFPPSFMVDDGISNAIDAVEAGHKAILFQTPQNLHLVKEKNIATDSRLKICTNWKEIIDYMRKSFF